jgi:oxygen-independent coproporphyrinogen-3 oxidase
MDRVNNRDPIGLYIHIPFCRKKCGYCDFYSITDLSFAEKYTEAVVRGILFYKSTYGLRFDSVYFGGGTPSLMTARQIEHMVEAGSPERNAEISMECNPNSVGTQFFSDVKAAGINRASIGIQSLSDGVLKTLGRLHSAAEAEAAIAHAAAAGFDNISVDLMIGVPGQHSLKSDIERLSALKNTDGKHIIKHISAYILKVEEDTPFADIPAENFPNEDTVSDIYLETVAELEANGFCQYEISNFSIPGFECCHNLKYWECKEYLGIGPAAHSYIDGRRFASILFPEPGVPIIKTL